MNQNDDNQLIRKTKSIIQLTEVLGRRRYSDTAITTMVEAVSVLTAEQVEQAVLWVIKNKTEMPTMNEIIEGVESGLYVQFKVTRSTVVEDWESFRRRMDQQDVGLSGEAYENDLRGMECVDED